MERKLRPVMASISFLYPHVEMKTGLEITRLESNRDEWEWNGQSYLLQPPNGTLVPRSLGEVGRRSALRKYQSVRAFR